MAERIPDLIPLRGRPPVYPWDEWADGGSWRIRRGSDFDVSAENVAQAIRQHGRKIGVKAYARVVDEDTVDFQFQRDTTPAAA